jgi:hypothetical protein
MMIKVKLLCFVFTIVVDIQREWTQLQNVET